MKAKLNGLKYNEKQDNYIKLINLTRYLLITKRKIVTLQWRNLANPTLTERSKSTSTVMGQINITCPLT